MGILRKVTPVVALLAAFLAVQVPAAQSMTILEPSGGNSKSVESELLKNKPLSVKESPTLIKNMVHIAWISGEFQWSSKSEWYCFDQIITHESGWDPASDNGAGWEETGGIPQAHPSNKMAEAGKDYRTNVWTQVQWGLDYIESAYGTPCSAWDAWQGRASSGSYGWY